MFSKHIWDPFVGNTDPSSVRKGMLQGIDQDAYTQAADDYRQRGEAFFDPGSKWNLDIKSSLMGMGADTLAQQNMMNTQNQAKFGGGGGFSGALAQAGEGAGQNMMNQTMGNWGNQFRQNMGQGTQMLGMADQQRGQLNSLLSGANQAKVAQQQQNTANTSGMLQGMAGAAMGGLGSVATNFGMNAMGMQGAGGGMSMGEAFMQPYAQGAQNNNLMNTAMMQYVQGMGAPAAAAGSDRRIKENIELIGKSGAGINIYEFDYKDKSLGEGRYRGVMADEVPEAAFKTDGYLWVDYNKVDVNFERIG